MNDILKHSGGYNWSNRKPASSETILNCAPLVSQLCRSFEDENINISGEHHSESAYLQKRCQSDVHLLLSTICTYGNPFLNTLPDITNIYIYTKRKANESSNTLIYIIDQFENFRHSVFVDGSQAIYTPIKQNTINLFEERKEKKNIVKRKIIFKPKKQLSSYKSFYFIPTKEC